MGDERCNLGVGVGIGIGIEKIIWETPPPKNQGFSHVDPKTQHHGLSVGAVREPPLHIGRAHRSVPLANCLWGKRKNSIPIPIPTPTPRGWMAETKPKHSRIALSWRAIVFAG